MPFFTVCEDDDGKWKFIPDTLIFYYWESLSSFLGKRERHILAPDPQQPRGESFEFLIAGTNVTWTSGAPNDNFRKNICSEGDLRSRIFETFVVKFLACLPLLGFSNI